MIKNILSVLVFLFSISFFFVVGNIYFSDKYKKKINLNRVNISEIIENNINGLLNMLVAGRDVKVKSFTYASSIAKSGK